MIHTILRRCCALVAVAVGLTLTTSLTPGVSAAVPYSTPLSGSVMMSHGKTVYVCTKCKEYYSPSQAKSMHYTDSMGHHLTKMSKAPAGYTMGGMSKGSM